MSSRASVTLPSRTTTSRPPSPSTRVSAPTLIDWPLTGWPAPLGCVMYLRLLAERTGIGVERAERAGHIGAGDTELPPPGGQARGIRGLHGAEAAVAAARARRADRPAPGLRHRAEARRAMGDHHAGDPGPLAFEADAVAGDAGLAAVQERGDHLQQLEAVDRAAAQLEVDPDVIRDRGRGPQGVDVVRVGVHNREDVVHLAEVPQRLDAAG